MYLGRRKFVAGGTAALAGVLAGCLGDDDGSEEENGTPEANGNEQQADDPLGIEHVRLVASEPDGYREYDRVDDGSYGTDDIVYVYYEPAGLSTDDAGDGERRFDVQLQLTVTGPDGEQFEDTEGMEQTVRSDADTDEQWLFWSYQPPAPTEPGEYTATITLVDEVADEQVEETVTFTIGSPEDEPGESDEPLGIEHVRLVASEPDGYREYDRVDDGSYDVDDTVYIYYEPTGLSTEGAGDGERRFDVQLRLTVTGPEGGQFETTDGLEQTVRSDADTDEQWLFWRYRPSVPVEPGEYTATITLLDEVADERVEETVTFTIEGSESGEDVTTVFQQRLTGELDITVRSFSVTDGTVELAYESQHDVEAERARYEIGFIAGAFGRTVREGWDVERMRAVVTDANGDRYRFTVERGLTQRWLDGELTDEEFAGQVLETLEPVDGDDES